MASTEKHLDPVDHRPNTSGATTADRVRQVTVTLAEVLCIVGTLMGIGVIGSRVAESSGGSLSSAATHLAPSGPAFSIWSVIYLGLFVYTVWQWLPANTTDPRHRTIGPFVAASMLLNALWLLVTQVGLIAVSVVVIVILLAALVQLVALLERRPARGRADRVITDGTFGLYLGWVAVAVVANVAAALADFGWRPGGIVADVIGAAVLLVVAVIGVGLARRFGARWAVSVAVIWGLGWIAHGRLLGSPRSVAMAVAAVAAAAVILAATTVLSRGRTRTGAATSH